MSYSRTQFQIQQLRSRNLQKILESIMVFIAALFTTALLPSLLVRYVYDQTQLVEQPMLLEYLPLVAFAIAFGYFVYVITANMMRGNKIKQLETELAVLGPDADEDGAISDAELAELEAMVDQVLETNETKQGAAKTSKSSRSKASSKSKRSKKSSKSKKSKK